MKVPKPADFVRFQAAFSVDVARGSSIIGSTIKSESRAAAIAEMADEFQARHGQQHLLVFLELLAQRLGERNAPAAAEAVRAYGQALTETVPVRARDTADTSARVKSA
jgi:predicted kinase